MSEILHKTSFTAGRHKVEITGQTLIIDFEQESTLLLLLFFLFEQLLQKKSRNVIRFFVSNCYYLFVMCLEIFYQKSFVSKQLFSC